MGRFVARGKRRAFASRQERECVKRKVEKTIAMTEQAEPKNRDDKLERQSRGLHSLRVSSKRWEEEEERESRKYGNGPTVTGADLFFHVLLPHPVPFCLSTTFNAEEMRRTTVFLCLPL